MTIKRIVIMKYIIGIIICCVCILSSCSAVRYNKIYRYKDEFTGSNREYVRIGIRPEERRTEIGNARVIIEKVEGPGGVTQDTYFVIMRAASSFGVDRRGFIRAGGINYEVELMDPVSEFRTKTEETLMTVSSGDSTGTTVSTTSDSDTRTWIEEKFMVRIPAESFSSVKSGNEVIFRFYFGPVPVTYVIKGKKLDLVREVLE